jgi:phosphatidylinositol alpha 1,6-mannosyltransferase
MHPVTIFPAMAQRTAFQVIVFTDTFFETNGVGSYYRTLLDWCRRRDDVHMTVICPERTDLADYEVADEIIPVRPKVGCRLPFYRCLKVGYYAQSSLRDLVSSIAGRKVIHIATSGPLGMAGAQVARKLGVPMVGCYHTDMQVRGRLYGRALLGPTGERLGERFGRYCDRLAYERCEAIYVPSASARETTRTFFSGRTEVIPNPVDPTRFRPGSSRGGWFRERYQKNGGALAIAVGRVAKEKNVHQICELLAHDKRIDLVFVGDGPDGPSIKRRWGVEVTGFLHGEDLLATYQQSDVFVQLSMTETFGLCLVEALACGLPAIVPRSPGLTENLPPGHGVEVLEWDELPTLGNRCVKLVSDKERHREFSLQAREFALRCGADAVLPKWVEFHKALAL